MGHKLNKNYRIQSIQYVTWLFFSLITVSLIALPTAFAGNKDENGIPWYQIELIIFANQNQQGMISETWPEPPALLSPEFLELTHPDDASPASSSEVPSIMPTPYELLKSTELQLIPIAKKLASSRKYQPLLHMGWRQPTLHPDKSMPIFVYRGIDLSLRADSANAMQPAAASNAGGSRFSSVAVGSFTYDSSQYGQLLPASEVDALYGPRLNPFYGTLRLSVSRYLHLEANLNYRIPIIKEELVPVNLADSLVSSGFQQNVAFTEQGDTAETRMQTRETLQNFNMFETRRMRSKEIHYFDHPLIGIIVRVIPYEIPEDEPDFDPASQAFSPGGGKPQVQSPQ